MSQGLQVWDAGGNQILRVTDRITRFVTSTSVYLTGTTTITVPGLVLDGTWFVYATSFNEQANFTASINTGSVTLQAIGTFSDTVNVLVFRS